MKTKHRISLGLMCVVLVFSGCITAPSQLSDLGRESASRKVVGTDMYVGFLGLSARGKEEVYESALRDALNAAPPGTTVLEDVKLWETQYNSIGSVGAVFLGSIPLVLALVMGDPDQIQALSLAVEALIVLSFGIEITKYTVVGAPVPAE